ncbi:MAG: PLP-dependent aminotransferase family protein [Armatimonadetes bacterium]|nr:PLP-dependent aminotransferase family protein [Armatimonadota bacterium]
MNLTIDHKSRTPIYVQIVERIKSGIASGEFAVGTRLTPVRKLAVELDVSRLTVFRAYTVLQDAGLVKGAPGRGTMIAPIKNGHIAEGYLLKFLEGGPVIGFEETSQRNNARSLATSVADPDLFDAESWLADMFDLRKESNWLFYLPEFAGQPEMRSAGALLLRRHWPDLRDEDVHVGGRHPELMTMVGCGLIERGSHVIVQEPQRISVEAHLTGLGYVPHGVKSDENGIDLEQVEMLAKEHGVACAIVEPTFGLAGGHVWPEANRRDYLKIAAKFDIVTIERMNSLPISFVDQVPKCLFALAPEAKTIANLEFGYTLASGISAGIRYVPQVLREWHDEARLSTGMPVDRVTQLTLAKMIRSDRYDAHFDRAIPVYRARRDALCEALKESLPEVSFSVPQGGLSVVITLPAPVDARQLFEDSVRAGVAVMPCRFLTTRGRGDDAVRLSYSMLGPEALRQAVAQWAPVLRGHLLSGRRTGTM